MVDDELSAPERSTGDIVNSILKAGLSVIPFAGGPAAELFQFVFQPPLERRRFEWMVRVGELLRELKDDGIMIEDLQKNDEFVSTVMHATQIALRTHQATKLDALRSAIKNIAKGQAPDETLQNVFLNLIDSFNGHHLRILKVFQEPVVPPNICMDGLSSVLEHNLPELNGKRELYDQLWKDLYIHGLVSTDGLHTTMSRSVLGQKRTTVLGDSFLKFIDKPKLD